MGRAHKTSTHKSKHRLRHTPSGVQWAEPTKQVLPNWKSRNSVSGGCGQSPQKGTLLSNRQVAPHADRRTMGRAHKKVPIKAKRSFAPHADRRTMGRAHEQVPIKASTACAPTPIGVQWAEPTKGTHKSKHRLRPHAVRRTMGRAHETSTYKSKHRLRTTPSGVTHKQPLKINRYERILTMQNIKKITAFLCASTLVCSSISFIGCVHTPPRRGK